MHASPRYCTLIFPIRLRLFFHEKYMPCHSERQESEPLRLHRLSRKPNIQSANPKIQETPPRQKLKHWGEKEQRKKENLRVEGRGKSSHPNRSEPESWLHHWRA